MSAAANEPAGGGPGGARVAQLPPSVADALDAETAKAASAPQGRRRPSTGARRTLEVEMTDGTVHTAHTIYADAMATRRHAAKTGGADQDEAIQAVYLVWTALRRAGDIDLSYPKFESQIAEIWDLTSDEDEDGDPTQPDL